MRSRRRLTLLLLASTLCWTATSVGCKSALYDSLKETSRSLNKTSDVLRETAVEVKAAASVAKVEVQQVGDKTEEALTTMIKVMGGVLALLLIFRAKMLASLGGAAKRIFRAWRERRSSSPSK